MEKEKNIYNFWIQVTQREKITDYAMWLLLRRCNEE